MSSAPIRQPRGPSPNATSFGPTASGPPTADSDSLLRRHNTVNNPRHQPSASVSSTPAATSAFHGAKYKTGTGASRFRSGSLSSGSEGGGLARKVSGRAVRTEEVLAESGEEGTVESVDGGSWGKGLGRQSSLPSRRGLNHVTAVTPAATPDSSTSAEATPPPPRPPRRISITTHQTNTTPPPLPTHNVSHSMSSIAMFTRPHPMVYNEEPTQGAANVSRTHSLRAQAKNAEVTGLGRSSSLKSAGEQLYRPAQLSQAMSPPGEPVIPRNPFTPPTPPPVSSTAALPSAQLPVPITSVDGADLKRHQSLTQGYGSSSRVRDRLERAALLSLDQRQDLGRTYVDGPTHTRKISEDREEPPTSPIGHSVWSTSQPGDDGWTRPAPQQMHDAFEAMQLGRKMMGVDMPEPRPGQDGRTALANDVLRQSQSNTSSPAPTGIGHTAEEPSWIAGLVGLPDGLSPQSSRVAPPGHWQERDAFLRSQGMGQMPQRWQEQPQFMGPPLGYLQQQQQMLNAGSYGNGSAMKHGMNVPPQMGQYHQQHQQYQPGPGYMPTPFTPMYPTPPPSAMPAQDADVIELARRKGLNPASFNCRPAAARFFVIKSYTEEDVQKSLKHEIWSSTVLGNKRLDAAFRESAEICPIYLFFSVNGSRHFCGVAQMLTSVDETRNSNVWAQDKWKGIFKVKWIFVRDVPSPALRHIRLMNTPEQKPITNSRDTQELHYEAGCEVLQIFLDHQTKSKTSLLQDFTYYEQLSANRGVGGPPSQPPSLQQIPPISAPLAMANLNVNPPMSSGPMPMPPGQPFQARFR